MKLDKVLTPEPLLENLLVWRTGKGIKEWTAFVQERIEHGAIPIKGLPHGASAKIDGRKDWLVDLVKEMRKHTNKITDSGDHNMERVRLVVSLLVFWLARVTLAKSRDPKRLLVHRKGLVDGHKYLSALIVDCLVDESLDAELFPGQEWSLPFVEKPKGEKRRGKR